MHASTACRNDMSLRNLKKIKTVPSLKNNETKMCQHYFFKRNNWEYIVTTLQVNHVKNKITLDMGKKD